jgi:putative endonuclease
LQKHQLFHETEQKKAEGKAANEKVLQKMQEAYVAQGDEITCRSRATG